MIQDEETGEAGRFRPSFSPGVEAMNLTPQTKAPEGGRLELDEGGGALFHAVQRPIILYQALCKLRRCHPMDRPTPTCIEHIKGIESVLVVVGATWFTIFPSLQKRKSLKRITWMSL